MEVWSKSVYILGDIDRPDGPEGKKVRMKFGITYQCALGYFDAGNIERFSFMSTDSGRLPDKEYFKNDPRYRSSIEKTTSRDGRVSRINNNGDFDPHALQEWDSDILELLRQLPDHVLDVIGFYEVFSREEESLEAHGKES